MQKIAHRGGESYALENSMDAFRKALQSGIKIIEFDIRYTKDKKIVVIHDSDVKRTTDGKGLVKNLTYKEIKNFHDAKGKPVPTFESVLKLLKGKCICKIDIKQKGLENKVIKMIKRRGMEKSVIITSKYLDVVKQVKKMCPEVKVEAGGFEKKIPIKEMIRKAKEVNADILSPHFSLTTKKLVEESHKNGLEVHVWPVNDKKTAEKMKKFGVDAVTTKYPDRI